MSLIDVPRIKRSFRGKGSVSLILCPGLRLSLRYGRSRYVLRHRTSPNIKPHHMMGCGQAVWWVVRSSRYEHFILGRYITLQYYASEGVMRKAMKSSSSNRWLANVRCLYSRFLSLCYLECYTPIGSSILRIKYSAPPWMAAFLYVYMRELYYKFYTMNGINLILLRLA